MSPGPVPTATNNHKLGGLKPHTDSLKSGDRKWNPGPILRPGVAGRVPLEAPGRGSVFLPFSAPEARGSALHPHGSSTAPSFPLLNRPPRPWDHISCSLRPTCPLKDPGRTWTHLHSPPQDDTLTHSCQDPAAHELAGGPDVDGRPWGLLLCQPQGWGLLGQAPRKETSAHVPLPWKSTNLCPAVYLHLLVGS